MFFCEKRAQVISSFYLLQQNDFENNRKAKEKGKKNN